MSEDNHGKKELQYQVGVSVEAVKPGDKLSVPVTANGEYWLTMNKIEASGKDIILRENAMRIGLSDGGYSFGATDCGHITFSGDGRNIQVNWRASDKRLPPIYIYRADKELFPHPDRTGEGFVKRLDEFASKGVNSFPVDLQPGDRIETSPYIGNQKIVMQYLGLQKSQKVAQPETTCDFEIIENSFVDLSENGDRYIYDEDKRGYIVPIGRSYKLEQLFKSTVNRRSKYSFFNTSQYIEDDGTKYKATLFAQDMVTLDETSAMTVNLEDLNNRLISRMQFVKRKDGTWVLHPEDIGIKQRSMTEYSSSLLHLPKVLQFLDAVKL